MLKNLQKKNYLPIILFRLLTKGHYSINKKLLDEITIAYEVGSLLCVSNHLGILLFCTFLYTTVCFFQTRNDKA